jgi:hypothetical protein
MLATFVFLVLFGLLCIISAGLSSAKHYERKKFYTTDPLLVKVTATEAFSRLAGMYAHLSHMFFIIFIHLFIFASIFIGLSPLMVWSMVANKTINNIRFAHWEKASLSLSFSRYCRRWGCSISQKRKITDEIYVHTACKSYFLIGYCFRFQVAVRFQA